ncbi:MAG: hypothetical protein U0169_27155 [Polyangiaceae bacterium]
MERATPLAPSTLVDATDDGRRDRFPGERQAFRTWSPGLVDGAVVPRSEATHEIVAPSSTATRNASVSLETLLPEFVRRIAWSGDRSRGAMDVELGRGVLAGARLVLTAEGSVAKARLEAPPGVDAEAWAARLRARFSARGLDVDVDAVVSRR